MRGLVIYGSSKLGWGELMTADTVLFDIGNVFVHWDPRRLYEKLIPDNKALDYFLANVVTLEWHSEHDRGRSFRDGADILIKQFPEHEFLIRQFDARWPETLGPVISGTVEILSELTAREIPAYALTNFPAEKWPLFRDANAFTTNFSGVLVSGEEGLIKPDPRIFELTIERFGLTPNSTVFIDDRADNVQAAEEMGMIGHLFKDPVTLRSFLEQIELL